MHEQNGESETRGPSQNEPSRLNQAVAHLLAEPPPADSMRRALMRAQRLAPADAKREAGKSAPPPKPRSSGFDQLEDRRALSGLAWDASGLAGGSAPVWDVVAVVTTESSQPVMASYSTQSSLTECAGRDGLDEFWSAQDSLLDSDVRLAVPIDFDQVEEDAALEDLLGTLVS